MSRHHIQMPPIYMPPAPKPKEARRKRGVGTTHGASEAEETAESEETNESPRLTGAHGVSVPQHQVPVERADGRSSSSNGKLSDGTLRAMLAVQEIDEDKAGQ